MLDYRHRVSGFYEQRAEAESALSALLGRGVPRERICLVQSAGSPAVTAQKAESKEALRDMVVDGALGAVVGTGLGALAEVALVAANVSLFVASPLIAPLALLGWGASIGGLLGAATGAGNRDKSLSALVLDAIAHGHVVLLVETHSERESATVKEVIQASVSDIRDVSLLYAVPEPAALRFPA